MKQMGIDDPNEAIRRINSGEWIVSQRVHRWREEDGVIYLSVTSDGTTGPQWIKRLEKKGAQISDWARQLLNSQNFFPTSGVTTEIAILKGTLFDDNDRITHKIRAEADRRGLVKPNPEAACLIRQAFSDEEIESMGLRWIVTMHDPIKDSVGAPCLLYVDGGGQWLRAGYDNPGLGWYRGSGFAFVVSVSQVSLGS